MEQAGSRIVFVTQPSLWRSDLPPRLERLLWMGGIGRSQQEPGKTYYSPGALERALSAFNETLLGVCAERGVTCIDLASALPKDETVFYDDVHFNESGARQVADQLADVVARLLTSAPE